MKPKNDIDWVNALAALKAAKAARKGVPWWVWFCLPLALLACGMAFNALNPDKDRGGAYVKGKDGNYHHRTKTAWQIADESLQVGDTLAVQSPMYAFYDLKDLTAVEPYLTKPSHQVSERVRQKWWAVIKSGRFEFLDEGFRVKVRKKVGDTILVETRSGACLWVLYDADLLPKEQ